MCPPPTHLSLYVPLSVGQSPVQRLRLYICLRHPFHISIPQFAEYAVAAVCHRELTLDEAFAASSGNARHATLLKSFAAEKALKAPNDGLFCDRLSQAPPLLEPSPLPTGDPTGDPGGDPVAAAVVEAVDAAAAAAAAAALPQRDHRCTKAVPSGNTQGEDMSGDDPVPWTRSAREARREDTFHIVETPQQNTISSTANEAPKQHARHTLQQLHPQQQQQLPR